jgi:hypothetical protein
MANDSVRGRRRVRRSPLRKAAAIAFPAILGIALIGLAVPRTIAALASLPAEPALAKIGSETSPTTAELEAAKRGLAFALQWSRSSRRLLGAAVVDFSLAMLPATEAPQKLSLLASAEQLLVESAGANPANGAVWFILAQVREQQRASGEKITSALIESVYMAPNNRLFWIPRAELLLRYWRFLDETELQIVRTQLRTIWAVLPDQHSGLLSAAVNTGEVGFLASLVGDDPVSIAAFDQFKTELKSQARSMTR